MATNGAVDQKVTERAISRPVADARRVAFRRLAEAHLEECYRLANAILGDPTEARDAVHAAFLRAWQRFSTVRDPARFEWWFKSIVVNICRNRLRHARRHRAGDIADHPTLPVPDHAARSHDRVLVEQALARLEPDDRVILALRFYRDLTVEQIAVLLDVPAGTVKSRLNRALERLRGVVALAQVEGR